MFRILLFGVWLLFGLLVCGLETNWLRYTPGIIGNFIVLIVIFVSASAAVGLFCSIITNGKNGNALLYGSVVAGFFLVVFSNMQGHGRLFPEPYLNHVVRSSEHEVEAWGKVYFYRLELVNPFSKFHKERLIIRTKNSVKVVALPLFDSVVSGYARPSSDTPWIKLMPTPQEGKFLMKTTKHIKSSKFIISLEGQVSRIPIWRDLDQD